MSFDPDFAAIERDRDLPPDEPYSRPELPDDEPPCPTCGSDFVRNHYSLDLVAVSFTCRDCGREWDA